MVFQNYALYPHMTVYKNMQFALKLRKVPHNLYIPNPEIDAINEEEKNIRNSIRKVNFKFKRKQNNKELLEERRKLYAEYYALEDKKEALLKPQMGIDLIGIKSAENEIKKIKKDIADLETRMINIKYYIDKDPSDKEYEAKAKEFGLEIQKQREQKLLEINKLNEHIDYLKSNNVPLYKIRKSTRVEMDLEINKAADVLDLDQYLYRKPSALSGGQRQRVALGRAIVRKPMVFLMDEPLSNLDAKLRVQTRSEISKLHKRVGATTIYVTHDQIEAMTMADRIVIMKDGYIQQIGTPSEVYDDPANKFVGGFIGSPSMNFIEGCVVKNKFVISKTNDKEKDISFELNKEQVTLLKNYDGKKVILGIRPEKVTLSLGNKSSLQTLNLECDYSELLGYEIVVYSMLNGQTIVGKIAQKDPIASGTKISLAFNNDDFYFFDIETEARIK